MTKKGKNLMCSQVTTIIVYECFICHVKPTLILKIFINTFIFIHCYASRQTHRTSRPLKVWATIVFSRGRCHLPLGLKQGYPFHSPNGCRLKYHQFEAWPVEQCALPPQFYVASVTTGIRTHTLLIKHQSLNPVLLTARPSL